MCRVPAQDRPAWLAARRALGDRVRARREYLNLRQEQLAERAAVSVDTLQRIEGAHSDPKLSHLWRIAAALDTPLADLVR